jgi:membrane-bound metal-dependent hydrolase YbcI (DUF457 family)
MRLRSHVAVELLLLAVLLFFLDAPHALAVAAAHFIPSLDYAMLKLDVGGRLHRKLFHNVFAAAAVFAVLYGAMGPTVAFLGLLNFLLHLTFDLRGNGVEVFYPFSGFRLRL